MKNSNQKIGKEITSMKTSGLNVRDRKDFEKFVNERRSKKTKEEEEQKISSKMPDEKQPNDDKVANEMSKLAQEKGIFSNNRKIIEDLCANNHFYKSV